VEITEIRIKLMEGSEDRLRAFCSITIDQSFVVRDLKIIDGTHGPFVAMPSRKLTGHCNRCGSKNHLRAGFCNQCGGKLHNSPAADSPQKLYADVAHPINSECREKIQNAVIEEFNAELQRSDQPDYRSRYDDDFDAGDYDEADYSETSSSQSKTPAVVPASSSPRPSVDRVKQSATDSTNDTLPESDDAFASDLFASGLFDDNAAANPSTAPTTATRAKDMSTTSRESQDSPLDERIDESQPDLESPHFATGSQTQDGTPSSGEASDSADDETIVLRSETGVSNTIPRPHFRDRPGGSHRETSAVNSPPTGGRSAEKTSTDEDKTDPIDSGFGAGILDD